MISMEECLSYTPYPKLEATLGYIVPQVIQSMKKKFESVDSNEAMQYFLQQSLLRLSISKNWTDISVKNNLTYDYLYVCLKRCYLLYTTK
ncbi:hypothetical protein [Candidatus Clostridium radicumherbarum]|uniref:Uncharacterized protein n=1 Tax=Candidatus Clostridium radicumherbarum TaxID=3381662 RepID=A0ABW8TY06_9CLOT